MGDLHDLKRDAARLAGLKKVPCRVLPFNKDDDHDRFMVLAVERLLLAVDRQIEAADEARAAREELARVQDILRRPSRRGRAKAPVAAETGEGGAS
ncbi:MAG: hypothetical protein NTW96_24845 [Planctomycetia bacterium]|nr:hypothetical protein [Planctomycetia bacterium]